MLLAIRHPKTHFLNHRIFFSDGIRGQHNTTLLGAGLPSPALFGQIAEVVSLDAARAKSAVERVRTALGRWDRFARDFEVSTTRRRAIAKALGALGGV